MRLSLSLAACSLAIATLACKRQPSSTREGNAPVEAALPGMPPISDPRDIYSEARAGMLSPVVRGFPDRVYVPNSGSNTVDVIDPHTFKIIKHFDVGKQPQHVVPSWDLK